MLYQLIRDDLHIDGKWLSHGLMDLLSPSGHREALEPHSLNLIQSMFKSLGGIRSSGEGS